MMFHFILALNHLVFLAFALTGYIFLQCFSFASGTAFALPILSTIVFPVILSSLSSIYSCFGGNLN